MFSFAVHTRYDDVACGLAVLTSPHAVQVQADDEKRWPYGMGGNIVISCRWSPIWKWHEIQKIEYQTSFNIYGGSLSRLPSTTQKRFCIAIVSRHKFPYEIGPVSFDCIWPKLLNENWMQIYIF